MAPVTKPKPILGKTYIADWREFRGLNQSQAADAANISRTLLSKMENGRSPYLQQHIEVLAALYQCTPADLIGHDPRLPQAQIKGADQILETLKRIDGLTEHDVQLHFELIMRDIKFNASEREQSQLDDQLQPATLRHELKP